MKFSITVVLKKDVLDPQGKVIEQTLKNMGMNTLTSLRKGKYFEIDIYENTESVALKKIDDMCQKLLVNLIIEDYNIKKI